MAVQNLGVTAVGVVTVEEHAPDGLHHPWRRSHHSMHSRSSGGGGDKHWTAGRMRDANSLDLAVAAVQLQCSGLRTAGISSVAAVDQAYPSAALPSFWGQHRS